MPTQIGTKKFWKPFNDLPEQENQILKNKGYITIQLVSVSYMSKGNFFQNIFGGTDKIALTSTVSYGVEPQAIIATSVQDVSEVKANKNYVLGIQRLIAEKVPANTNSLRLSVKMTAIKDDILKSKFDMLNKDPFQSALKLAPGVVGQVLTITSLVHDLFTDSGPQQQLEASFAGIISDAAEATPISSGKLTQGLLFMISTDDGRDFTGTNPADFTLVNYTLNYKGQAVENTYVVLRITFEENKGEDQMANWSIKYNSALSKLDDLQIAEDQEAKAKILKDAKALWIDGNALIDADVTYLNAEKIKIKSVALQAITDKYNSATAAKTFSILSVPDMLHNLSGLTSSYSSFAEAMPETGSLINEKVSTDDLEKFLDPQAFLLPDDHSLLTSVKTDTGNYLAAIGKADAGFSF